MELLHLFTIYLLKSTLNGAANSSTKFYAIRNEKKMLWIKSEIFRRRKFKNIRDSRLVKVIKKCKTLTVAAQRSAVQREF